MKNHSNPTPRAHSVCDCQKSRKHECPIPGACNQNGAIYQATVSTDDGREETYVGLANKFKKRFTKHRATLQSRTADGQTTMSNYVWEQKDKNMDPKVSWKILGKNVPDFSPVTNICRLCTREKFQIVLNPIVASLNHHIEIFSACRHKPIYLIGDPPD